MSSAGNSSEANGADPNNMHSTSHVQTNQFTQPIQPSYWIPGNNNMGSVGMPYGFYGFMPFNIYDMSAMMPTSLMPNVSSNLCNVPHHQSYPSYLHIQQLQHQMLMPPMGTPMIIYNPMFAGNQGFVVNSNQTANTNPVQDSVPRSMNDGVLENPPSTDTSSEVTSIQSPVDNPNPSRPCQRQSPVHDSVSRSTNDGILENSPLTDTLSKVTSSQSPIGNVDPSRMCQTQSSGQDSVSESSSNEVLQNSPLTSLEATENAMNDPTTASPSTPLPTKDTSCFETENSSSKETPPEVTNSQSFIDNSMRTDNPNSSETCEKQSEQDAVPPPLSDGVSTSVSSASSTRSEMDMSFSENRGSSSSETDCATPGITAGNSVDSLPHPANASPSTPSPQTLDCSTNVSPTRASESSMQAPVPRCSAAFTSSVPADTKTPQKRRYSQCRCPYCKTDSLKKPRFSNGCLKHICHFRHCGRVFHRPAHLKRHVKWHDGRAYFCARCQQGFARKVELAAHIEAYEKSEPSGCQGLDRNSEADKNSKGRGQYICDIPNCGKVFTYSWVLKRHLKWHNNNEMNFICQHCDRKYARESMLNSHVKNVHMTEPSKPKYANSNGRAPSSYSVREAPPQEIDIDFNLQSTSSKHTCQFAKCGKAYMSFNRLREHTKAHFGAALYVCPWPSCGKEFTRVSYLQAHQVIHTDEKK